MSEPRKTEIDWYKRVLFIFCQDLSLDDAHNGHLQ
jgi:hypothetical protein